MPPKEALGKSDGKNDEGDLQSLLLEKDLEIETLMDNKLRLEKRSQSLTSLTDKQQNAMKEMEEKLQDVISCLTGENKLKQTKVYELEQDLKDLRLESTKEIDSLTKDLNELKNTHKFVTEDLRLQLANAEVQLRDIDDFRAKKTATEEEIAGLKEQLEKEKKEHQDAMSDVERAALQEKERLKKEMAARIEETKMQMLQQMDEQLHAKTKRTILENEQLGREVGYHTRQTELLLQKNEKLVQENIELHRQVLLAKEVEDDLARRNHMNQKTIRILLYKLREKHHTNTVDQLDDEGELKRLISHTEQPKVHLNLENQELEKVKIYIEEQTRVSESLSSAEEAMKFLYACLEDIEIKKIDSLKQPLDLRLETTWSPDAQESLQLPSSLNLLTPPQRQEFLMHLLRTAVSRRSGAENPTHFKESEDFPYLINSAILSSKGKVAVSMEDILNLPVDSLPLNETMHTLGSNMKPISVGMQTEAMDLEERIALEIKERLRSCSSTA